MLLKLSLTIKAKIEEGAIKAIYKEYGEEIGMNRLGFTLLSKSNLRNQNLKEFEEEKISFFYLNLFDFNFVDEKQNKYESDYHLFKENPSRSLSLFFLYLSWSLNHNFLFRVFLFLFFLFFFFLFFFFFIYFLIIFFFFQFFIQFFISCIFIFFNYFI